MTKMFRCSTLVACVAGMLYLAAIARAQAPVKGEAVVAAVEITATVTKINHKTRAVTLKASDGQEYSFVAGDAVKNLAQVKTGDVVTAAYTEALVYEVKKGGKAGTETAVAGGTAASGKKPAGAIGQQTTVTVKIAAIDAKVPSVTFKGPAGNTRTLKVLHPEKLQGVSVGDTVEITYTEALAIKVAAAKK